jgi:hypothetical protein
VQTSWYGLRESEDADADAPLAPGSWCRSVRGKSSRVEDPRMEGQMGRFSKDTQSNERDAARHGTRIPDDRVSPGLE